MAESNRKCSRLGGVICSRRDRWSNWHSSWDNNWVIKEKTVQVPQGWKLICIGFSYAETHLFLTAAVLFFFCFLSLEGTSWNEDCVIIVQNFRLRACSVISEWLVLFKLELLCVSPYCAWMFGCRHENLCHFEGIISSSKKLTNWGENCFKRKVNFWN